MTTARNPAMAWIARGLAGAALLSVFAVSLSASLAADSPTVRLGKLAQARAGHAAVLMPDGAVLLVGGRAKDHDLLASAEVVDPRTLRGTLLPAELTSPRTEHAATLLPTNEMLLVGGRDAAGVLFSAELRQRNGIFVPLPATLQIARAGHSMTLLADGRVLILGGRDVSQVGLAEGEAFAVPSGAVYDPRTGAFTLLPHALVLPRHNHTATLLPTGQVLVAGGRQDNEVLDSAELVDPATGESRLLDSHLQTGRLRHTGSLLNDGHVLIAGGRSNKDALDSFEVYDPVTQTFEKLEPKLREARFNHTATVLPTGEILLAGGREDDDKDPTRNTELYRQPGQDTTPPAVLEVTPANDATTVTRTPLVSIRFSEPIRVTTLTGATLTLTGPQGSVAGTVSPGESGLLAFFVPAAPLAEGTTYTLQLNGLTDRAGNPLAPRTSSFTTILPAPTITSFTPTSGTAGTAVTISGTNLDPVASQNQVTFNGALATVTASSATSLTATVPSGATTGPITVLTRGRTATSATTFTVITAPPPAITSFSPITGRIGDPVTILGSNFDPTPAGNTVRFGTLVASVVSGSPTQLVVTVPLNVTTAALSVTTAGGIATTAGNFVPIVITTLTVAPGLLTLPTGQNAPLHATAGFSDGTSRDVSSLAGWNSSNSNAASVTTAGVALGVAPGPATLSATFGGLTATVQAQVIQSQPGDPPLPPDPSSVAPPLNRTVATTLGDATAFLYSGANPIQTGVAAGTIQPLRAAVIRGIVRTRDGFPLPGVTITVLGHPEFGQTVTRPDGQFDLAVNGGGPLTVQYKKAGFLPAQRQVPAPWRDYAIAPEVVLVPPDSAVTLVDLSLPTMQPARGSVMTDADGTRQATVLVPAGTTATMTLPNGTTQPLSTLHVRATEYTVGPTGPQAMPAELPANSGYTYAVEWSVDEALAAGAKAVTFSQPVISYVENFLGFPVGASVPTGVYDFERGQWAATSSGQVIRLVSVGGGVATLDLDGDGAAEGATALAALGITDAERQQLAGLYPAGQSLWRVRLSHFSLVDYNWSPALPFGAVLPNQPTAAVASVKDPCAVPRNSTLLCENQALSEEGPVQGTPFRLVYQSDRVRGRAENKTIDIPLSGPSIPASLRRIELTLSIAGRQVHHTVDPVHPNAAFTFTWDGQDAYGRLLQGLQTLTARIDYIYPAAMYQATSAFGQNGSGIPFTSVFERREVITSQTWRRTLGGWATPHLGGWTLDRHHAYDLVGRTLYLGDGRRLSTEALGQLVRTVAGNGLFGSTGDGGPATSAQLGNVSGVAAAPDGSVYLVDYLNGRIRKVDPQGIITTIAGGGADSTSEGILASAASLGQVTSIALGPDGTLYLAEAAFTRIRRIDPQGRIWTFAGNKNFHCFTNQFNGQPICAGDGLPATDPAVRFGFPGHLLTLALDRDGNLYIADAFAHRVWRVGTDGILTTVAGIGVGAYNGDGIPATAAMLNAPFGVAAGPDGSLYISTGDNRVRRVGTDGIMTTVAGVGTGGYNGDGIPANGALLNSPQGLAVDADGALYIADVGNMRIRRVGRDGLITTVAWDGATGGYGGDGGLALRAAFANNDLWNLAVGPDGSLYIPDRVNNRLRRVSPAFASFSAGDLLVPSEDGSELYEFTSGGKHLRTLEVLTGAVRLTFSYDATSGLLTSVTDADGQVTTIERSGSTPTALVAPGGQRTALTVYGDGYLATSTNPGGETVELTYATEGILATRKDPRGHVARYTYDPQGRLLKDDDAAGGFHALARTDTSTGWTIARSTALNRTTTYQVETLATGDQRRINTDPSGLLTTSLIGLNGTRTITAPDGTVTTPVDGPDPRFGMQAPILSSLTVQTPVGLSSTLSTTRAVTLTTPNDPLSLATQTDTLVINGRTYTSIYTQATRILNTSTPANRTSSVALDPKGRVSQEQVTGLEAVSYSYDALGRLSTITQGTGVDARTSTLAYNSKHELVSITDPLGRTVGFAYDLAGRITTQTLPDMRTIGYAYDANGNVTAITPPGKPAHTFGYTPVDLESNYTPPDVGFSPRNTQYTYNLDRQLTLVTRPDGQTLSLGYEPTGGRLSTLTLPGSQTLSYAYHPTTGTLSTITAPGNSLTYAYDGSLLTSTTWTGTVSGSVTRAYDNNFRITSQSVNGANTIAFGYDNDSLLTSSGALTITRSVQHGLITGTTLGSVTDSRSYSTFGELSQYTANVSGSPVLNVTYTRDKLGRITQKVETISGVTETFDYTYDLAGRLKEVKKNGAVLAAYNYDSNGNRLSRVTSSGTTSGTYDAQDRLTQYGTTSYTYTANGELASTTTGGQTTTYTYDVLGNLKSVVGPTGTTIEYVVDGQNRRIGKKLNGVLVQGFLYQNQLNPVAELDGNGAVVSRFVYGTKANVPDYMVKGGVTYRILSDYLGSPRLVINTSDGTVAQRLDYDEFGNVSLDTNPGFQPFGFAGGLSDQHTGLVRFGARDYDAVTGRWTAKDPIKFTGGDPNLYLYAHGDPLNNDDQFGLQRSPRPQRREERPPILREPGEIPNPGEAIHQKLELIEDMHKLNEMLSKKGIEQGTAGATYDVITDNRTGQVIDIQPVTDSPTISTDYHGRQNRGEVNIKRVVVAPTLPGVKLPNLPPELCRNCSCPIQ